MGKRDLFIRAFSRTFPHMFKRFIGRYLETSSLFSLPGFVIGMSTFSTSMGKFLFLDTRCIWLLCN